MYIDCIIECISDGMDLIFDSNTLLDVGSKLDITLQHGGAAFIDVCNEVTYRSIHPHEAMDTYHAEGDL